jgi:hypothetical protein
VLCTLNGFDINPLLHHFPQRAHLPQLVDVLDRHLDGSVHLGIGGESTNAIPVAGMSGG